MASLRRRRQHSAAETGDGDPQPDSIGTTGRTMRRSSWTPALSILMLLVFAAALFWNYSRLPHQRAVVVEEDHEEFVLRRIQQAQWKLRSPRVKIVGLVEVRNVAHALEFFLGELRWVVDAVVLLDDHSSDDTTKEALRVARKFNIEIAAMQMKGPWSKRDEQSDYNYLISEARRIGGTHFISLDYDEFISSNCGRSGRLRQLLGNLKPGHSLKLPWIETWRSPHFQRIMPGSNPPRNILNRRQIVMFADDRKVKFDEVSAQSRFLGENGTIHTLRCPRTLCPRIKEGETHPRVHNADQCAIIEMKFMNMDNALLKAAWYEALGRFSSAPDGTTHGGLMDFVGPPGVQSEPIEVIPIPDHFLDEDILRRYKVFHFVETWRAKETLGWIQRVGRDPFLGLERFPLIDWNHFRRELEARPQDALQRYVPRLKVTRLVLVSSTTASSYARQVLSLGEYSAVANDTVGFQASQCVGSEVRDVIDYEKRRAICEPRYRALVKARAQNLILDLNGMEFLCKCQDVLVEEFGDFEVDVLHIRADGQVPSACTTEAGGPLSDDEVHTRLLELQRLGRVRMVHVVKHGALLSASTVFALLQDMDYPFDEPVRVLQAVEEEHARMRICYGDNDSECGPNHVPVAKLIFSTNAGRSGSRYLADVFASLAEPIVAEHEPSCPNKECSSGGSMPMQSTKLEDSYVFRRQVKRPMIESALVLHAFDDALYRETNQSSLRCNTFERRVEPDHPKFFESRSLIYAETNPNFKSWFHDVVYNDFGQDYSVTVLNIRKYLPAVVKSLYEIGWFTSKPNGYGWIETLASVNSRVNSNLSDDSVLDAYEKLFSYIANTEGLVKWMSEAYKDRFDILNLRAERLYSKDGVLELLQGHFGFTLTEDTFLIAGTKVDKRRSSPDGSKNTANSVTLSDCESRWTKFLQKCSEGISLPDMTEWSSKFPGFDYGSDD